MGPFSEQLWSTTVPLLRVPWASRRILPRPQSLPLKPPYWNSGSKTVTLGVIPACCLLLCHCDGRRIFTFFNGWKIKGRIVFLFFFFFLFHFLWHIWLNKILIRITPLCYCASHGCQIAGIWGIILNTPNNQLLWFLVYKMLDYWMLLSIGN